MPPKKHATRGSTARSAVVEEKKKAAKTPGGTNASRSAAATVIPPSASEGDDIPKSKQERDENTTPATNPKSSSSQTTTGTRTTTVPSFTSYEIPGTAKPIPCKRSLHARDVAGQATSTSSPSPSPCPPDLVFTHGAGGDLTAAKMVQFSHGFASTGSSIVMFQGNMNLTARAKGFESVLAYEKPSGPKTEAGAAVAFGGRSMGARAAVVASQSQSQTGARHGKLLVLASYPLVGQAKGDLRDAILLALPADTSVLFISGDHDSMCPLAQLEKVRAKMKAQTWLVTVISADHGMDLHGGKALKKGTEEVGRECGRIAARWLRQRDDGVREMVIRWDGERERVVGGWGDESAQGEPSRGSKQDGQGIKRFFSKIETDPNDAEGNSGASHGGKNKKVKS